MVKGVNKTVIEVNNTGSKMFEKIVFYVTPQYGNLSAKRLNKAASEFSFNFDESGSCYQPLRKCFKSKRRARMIGLACGLLVVVAAVVLIIIL